MFMVIQIAYLIMIPKIIKDICKIYGYKKYLLYPDYLYALFLYISVPVILKAEEETWYWWVVGVCLGLIVILILALVVLPYWMWRNRVILIMKIVHYFRRYEDDGEFIKDQ